MDPHLLRHYNEELAHLREVGAEFAHEFPKIAARLSLDGLEVADPYVERLLEGFAFMAARIRVKLDAEHPRFVQHLLETVYPGFLAPVPSMMIARLRPDLDDPNLAHGYAIPRGSALHSEPVRGQETRCEFRTAHAVTLWPISIESVQYFAFAPDLPLSRLPDARRVRGGLKIRLRLHGGLGFGQLPIDTLRLCIAAPEDVAWRLHECVLGDPVGSWIAREGQAPAAGFADGDSIAPVGFADDEALLPETLRGFSGHRLLQELAALPQRFLFFDLRDLRRRLAGHAGTELTIALLFSRADAGLEPLVDAGSLALHCTPAINLFPKRVDRVALGGGTTAWEHQVVADRVRPMDYEIHTLTGVTGHGVAHVAQQRFLPLYASFHDPAHGHDAFFTVRREPRLLSARQRQDGPRSAYVGQEVFVSLVDPHAAPYAEELRQLGVTALVTNRDLPLLLPGTSSTFTLDAAGPVARVEALRGPSAPVQRLARGDAGWAMVSLLTLNYLSIAGEDARRAASALRTLLALFGPEQDVAWSRQLESLHSVDARTVVRRLPFPGPLCFGCGIQVTVSVDELGFQGASAFLFGQVLARFFARHASANSFCETVLRGAARGEILRSAPCHGARAVL